MGKCAIILCLLMALLTVSPGSASAQQNLPAQRDDGFHWVTWLSAGDRVWKAVMRIEPRLKDVIGDGRTVAVAVDDVDHDGQNDIILYFWGAADCGADGCLYVVLTYNGRTKKAYVAHELQRFGEGVKVDDRYYRFM